MQIVIAWVEEEQQLVKAGRVDIGELNKFKTVAVGKSCMWLNKGTDGDVAKATKYAALEGKSVFCYDRERDPLSAARRDVLEITK